MRPAASPPKPITPSVYRKRLSVTLALVVAAAMVAAIAITRSRLVAEAEDNNRRAFEREMERLQRDRDRRIVLLAERCRQLAQKPRILAALEDDALDLLYPSARDELRDLSPMPAGESSILGAKPLFYRFLDAAGNPLLPAADEFAGHIDPTLSARLRLNGVPDRPEFGVLARPSESGTVEIVELLAVPIRSGINPDGIATLTVGFSLDSDLANEELRAFVIDGNVYSPQLTPGELADLSQWIETSGILGKSDVTHSAELGKRRHLATSRLLNPESPFPPVHEIILTRLDAVDAALSASRTKILAVGAGLLIVGLLGVPVLARRLATPVEELARSSTEHAQQRDQAKAALEMTQAELDRAARFSANASHQLRTPLAVLRAGLDEVLAAPTLPNEVRIELEHLTDQTQRLAGIIDELLLLSRMDAGRLKLEFGPVDLGRLIEACVDDVSILPDELGLAWTLDLAPDVKVSGEKRYLLHVVRNLIDNARRYNKPGGQVRLQLRTKDTHAILWVGNPGQGIPEDQQAHLFDRFHRAGTSEAIPGTGLGLSLARDLARLHRGELRLLRSDSEWTEFEVILPLAYSAA